MDKGAALFALYVSAILVYFAGAYIIGTKEERKIVVFDAIMQIGIALVISCGILFAYLVLEKPVHVAM
jgi:hypothetical protein